MDFCYLVRRNAISASDLTDIKDALARFHRYRKIFIATGVRIDIYFPSTPTRPRSLQYPPWVAKRRMLFNHGIEMLVTLKRLDKIAAFKSAVAERGMLTGTTSSYTARVLAGEQPQVAPAGSSRVG
ncbi:hypothetical protein GGX14DRAFT_574107 [Mycena pura]|uniref:Uncharacterized protein n=1 Tax=Mycena pura TaxID=153505 RepID=A0AAD6UYS2_9AGAR|nr:hypothetical protein GGX14DRAFT_574107 [Mycena pura]